MVNVLKPNNNSRITTSLPLQSSNNNHKIKLMAQEETKLAVIATDIHYIQADVAEIKRLQQVNYVTKEEFYPIKRVVYGLVGIMGAITTALIVFLLQKALK